MRRPLPYAPLISRRPPMAIAAAWLAATVGVAGLVATHPAASSWHAFTSYAVVGPFRDSSPAITPGEQPEQLVLESVLDAPPPAAPAIVAPSEPIFVTRQPAAAPAAAPTAAP